MIQALFTVATSPRFDARFPPTSCRPTVVIGLSLSE